MKKYFIAFLKTISLFLICGLILLFICGLSILIDAYPDIMMWIAIIITFLFIFVVLFKTFLDE